MIAAANKKVCAIDKIPGAASRMLYLHLTEAQKYHVGKRAVEFGTIGIKPDISPVFH